MSEVPAPIEPVETAEPLEPEPPPASPPPRVAAPSGIDRAAVLAFALAAALTLLFTYAGVTAFLAQSPFFGERIRLLVIGSQILGLLLPAIILTALLRASRVIEPDGARENDRVPRAVALRVLAATGACFVMSALALELWSMGLVAIAPEWVREAEEMAMRLYGPLVNADGWMEGLLTVLTIVATPAICEEVAFRGLVQRALSSKWSAPFAIGLTSVLFAAFHVQILGFPSRMLLSISLGVIYARTGSLLWPALAHAAHNILTFGLSLAFATDEGAEPIEHLPPIMALALIPLLAVTVIGWLALLRRVPDLRQRALANRFNDPGSSG